MCGRWWPSPLPGERGRLPVIGEMTSGGLICYQENWQRGMALMVPLISSHGGDFWWDVLIFWSEQLKQSPAGESVWAGQSTKVHQGSTGSKKRVILGGWPYNEPVEYLPTLQDPAPVSSPWNHPGSPSRNEPLLPLHPHSKIPATNSKGKLQRSSKTPRQPFNSPFLPEPKCVLRLINSYCGEHDSDSLMCDFTKIYWGPDMKSWLIGKDPDAGKDWRQEETRTTENEIVGWHHRLSGRESANSRRWWRTGKPGVLQSMGSQSVRHNWVTEQQQLRA